MNCNDRLLSRVEVEERFGIPKRYLEMAVMRGGGPPFIKLGRLVRYRIDDIEAWLNRQRIVPEQIWPPRDTPRHSTDNLSRG